MKTFLNSPEKLLLNKQCEKQPADEEKSDKLNTRQTARQREFCLPDVKYLGQVFTPDKIVLEMLALCRNKGSVLEPACGQGAFLKKLNKAVGIELDESIVRSGNLSVTGNISNTLPALKQEKTLAKRVAKKEILLGDFFSYSTINQFDTIIGNPPYVKFRDIRQETKYLLPMRWFDRRSNLYLFFIAKSMAHLRKGGELIFITPRDFLKATSARTLNSKLYEQGSITYYRELGDTLMFDGYSPNCAIWRWQKGRYNRRMLCGQKWFNHHKGQLWFGRPQGGEREGRLSDLFEVKVGAVSGADHIFINEKRGNADMVCSFTASTGRTRRMIYNRKEKCLWPHKQELIQRRIRVFNESNWWEWGRKYCDRKGPRIYVNCKTRNPKPFFTHKSRGYNGSVMALFPKDPGKDIGRAVEKLNNVNWRDLGFACDGRLLFTQQSLLNAPVELRL